MEGNGKAIGHDKLGRFVRGRPGGPGRPLGSRNRLSEKFLSDLQKVWLKKGAKALDRVADEEPAVLVKVVANLMPREMLAKVISVNANVDVPLFADAKNFLEAFRMARSYIGADEPPLIEATAEPEEAADELPPT